MNRTGTGPAIGIKAATRHNAMAAGSNHLLKLHRSRAIFRISRRRRSLDVHSRALYFSLFMIGSLFINA